MRLLEFSRTDPATDDQETAHIAARITARIKGQPGSPPARVRLARQTASAANPEARVIPARRDHVHTPAQRPIDLENLQQRVEMLEKRIRMRVAANQTSNPELEQLKQRLLLLERNITNELWAAKQREHTLLELLARPPLIARTGKVIEHFWHHQLPAIGRWLIEAAREWWEDRQPDWWPEFTRAWQKSLDSARDSFTAR